MNKKNKNSSLTAILNNFQHKMSISENSVENTTLQKVLSFDDLNNGKPKSENRLEAFRWVEDLRRLAYDAEYNSVVKSLNGENDKVIEQEKLAILYKIGWFYNGNFYRKNKNINSKIGYPNLAFNISVRKIEKSEFYTSYSQSQPSLYMYMASYGIVDGHKDSTGGSYSLFLTLDDCITFILNELEYSHKDILYLKEVKRLFSESDNSQKMGLRGSRDKSKEEQKKETAAALNAFSSDPKVQKQVRENIANLTTNANIEKELHNLRRSSDTTTLLDFIDGFVLKLAKKNYHDAIKHEEEMNKANKLVENYENSSAHDDYTYEEKTSLQSGTPVRNAHRISSSRISLPTSDKITDGNDNVNNEYHSVDSTNKNKKESEPIFVENDYSNINKSFESTTTQDYGDINKNFTSEEHQDKDYEDIDTEDISLSTEIDNNVDYSLEIPTHNVDIEKESDYNLDITPESSVNQEKSFNDIEFEYTEDEENIFNDEDVLDRIRDIMPGVFNHEDNDNNKRSEEESIDNIINRF